MNKLELVHTLLGHQGRVWDICWHPKGNVLASCGEDKTIRIWGKEGSKWVWKAALTDGHTRTIREIAWSPCGNYLASASFDATTAIWDKKMGEFECIATLEGHENEVKSVSWAKSGQLLATCSRDKSVWVWEITDGEEYECAAVLNAHTQDVKKVVWHPHLDILASASYDNTVKLFKEDPADNDWICVATLDSHESTVWSLAFDKTGHRIATCSDDRTVKIWQEYLPGNAEGIVTPDNKSIWKCVCTLSGYHGRTIYDISWCHETELIATACGDDIIRIFKEVLDSNPNEPTFTLLYTCHKAHSQDVNSVMWSPKDPGLLASASDDDCTKKTKNIPSVVGYYSALNVMYSCIEKHIFHVLKNLRVTKTSSQNILVTQQFSDLLFLNKQLNWSTLLDFKGTRQFSKMTTEKPGLDLNEVVRRLDHYAPKHLAESWDNVGLLLEPSMKKIVKKIILTNDLTEEVMDEALEAKVDLIITYHPLIFKPLKSILERSWKERIIAQCFENRIAVYSPHTSFDVINGGVNDWLASAFETCSVKPLIQKYAPDFSPITHLVEVKISITGVEETFKAALKEVDKNIELNVEMLSSGDHTKLAIPCSESSLPKLMKVYKDHVLQKAEGSSFRVLKYEDVPVPNVGVGRLCLLKTPLKVKEVVEMVKQHIGKPHLRLALAVKKTQDATVSNIALCAGSGASVLRGASADLFLTGEMLHHDILDATHRGSHVILCDHSDSERGFLKEFCETLSIKLLENNVEVVVSKTDKDPTIIV